MTADRPALGGARVLPGSLAPVFVALCCGALGLLAAAAGPLVFLGTLFAPLVMVPVTLLLLVVSGYTYAAILRSATGTRRVKTAVALALLAPACSVAELAAQAEIPLSPYHGVPVPVLVAGVVAGVSVLVLRGRVRVVGAVVILLVVAVRAW